LTVARPLSTLWQAAIGRRAPSGHRSDSSSMPANPTRGSAHRQRDVRGDLARLGIDRLVLSIHQASFPAGDDDLGHGTPYSSRAEALLAYAARLGFTGVALGPHGVTSRDNASPYDASALSRNPLHVALGPLAAAGLLDDRLLATAVAERPDTDRVAYAHAWDTCRRLLDAVVGRARGDAALTRRRTRLRSSAPWIAAEARLEASPDAFELAQLVAAEQHDRFRARARDLGLAVYGDLAAGIAYRDRAILPHLFGPLFLPGWAMGAPPSRTNPDGQPWEFPVLDPRQLGPGGAARGFLVTRIDDVLTSYDGVRIDHPHGWVCPWVYRPGQPVADGARLHESPDVPELAGFAHVRIDQLAPERPRHDDAWVKRLEPAQIDRYATAIDLLVDRVRARGGDPGGLMVEVLSTCPRPLAAVLARHGLGRFRVTQKARVDDPGDVYRGDNAAPADWIMVGNHDTPPLRAVIDGWRGTAELARRAAYLGGRLGRDPAALERDPHALATAMLAELFLGPARNVVVFWVDLFGLADSYNRPGVIDPANWSLRVPADFEAAHAAAVASGDAPDLAEAVAWAIAARG
jgi:4-alpha-glucanotransferase